MYEVKGGEKPVYTDKISDNDTWADCPRCKRSWKEAIATPGLIHRTRYCDSCVKEMLKNGDRT